MRNVKHIVLTSCLIAILLLLLLAAHLDNHRYAFFSEKGIAQKDILYRTLGEARKVFSASSAITADVYLHGGLYPSDFECLHIAEQLEKGHNHEREEGHVHEHEEEYVCDEHYRHLGRDLAGRRDDEVTGISRFNILFYLGEKINISKHIHLHGEEEKEILPWLYYAVRLDPQNVNAYVIGGHWLGRRLQKTDEAIWFLQEGMFHNPDSWEIHEEMGMIYFARVKDHERALEYLQKARQLLRDNNSDNFNESRICAFIGGCYERLGDKDKAEEFYLKSRKLHPNRI